MVNKVYGRKIDVEIHHGYVPGLTAYLYLIVDTQTGLRVCRIYSGLLVACGETEAHCLLSAKAPSYADARAGICKLLLSAFNGGKEEEGHGRR